MALVPCLYFRMSGFLDKGSNFGGEVVGNIKRFLFLDELSL